MGYCCPPLRWGLPAAFEPCWKPSHTQLCCLVSPEPNQGANEDQLSQPFTSRQRQLGQGALNCAGSWEPKAAATGWVRSRGPSESLLRNPGACGFEGLEEGRGHLCRSAGGALGARLFSWRVAELEAGTKGDAEVRWPMQGTSPVRKDGLGGF